MAPALVISDENNSRGQGVIVNEGDHLEGIDFDLMPGGVITGKVTDKDGQPIVEERVNLLWVDRRGPSYQVSSGSQTDDRGIYRIFGIRPGRYKVSVGQDSVYRGVEKGRHSLPTTFHPDASEAAQAGVIEIREGSEATSIDITVGHARQGFAVSGQVIEADNGKPV